MSSLSPLIRLRLLQATFILLLGVLGLQATRLQVVDPALPPEYADGLSPRTVATEPPRGLITDRNGEILARNVAEFRATIIPGELPADVDAHRRALLALEEVLDVPYATLEAAVSTRLAQLDPYAPVPVRDGIEREEAVALRAAIAGRPGVRIEAISERLYITEKTLAHILGTIGALPQDEIDALRASGYPAGGRIGLTGVEGSYEDTLRGDPGRRLILADPQGREVAELDANPAEAGADLVLAIDLHLQRITAEALARGIEAGLSVVRTDTGQERPAPTPAGAAVLMDVHTGEILASVSLPSYDPNLFSTGDTEAIQRVLTDPARPLIDRTYMEVRSPGSVYKALVALAALEEGIATPDTRITSTGAIRVQDQYNPSVFYVFRDWMAHGTVDMYRAMARSSDVYFYLLVGGLVENGREVFTGMGAATLAKWSRLAGLGHVTGIDLPGEARGLVPDPDWKEVEIGEPWLLGDTYPYAIGQGYLTVTPLQLAVMTAAIANGGQLLQPRIVRAVAANGQMALLPPVVTGEIPASAASFQVVQRAMLAATVGDGTARTGVPAGISIGGKTGTAEFGMPYPDGEFDTHGWYIGFAPYDEPEVAVVVFLEHGVGATHAGPVARDILEAYFSIDRVSPSDRVAEPGGAR